MTKLNVEFLQWKSQMLPMILCFKIKNYKLLKYLNKVLKTKMVNVCFILEQEGLIMVKVHHLQEGHFGKFLKILFQEFELFLGDHQCWRG